MSGKAHTDGESPQERYEKTFQIKRMAGEQPSAVEILQDFSSAVSVTDYYKKELEKRHDRFEKEKQWPFMSQEEQKLIEHYQHYMENVKVHQDLIMRTLSLPPNAAAVDSPPESPQNMSMDSSSVSSDPGNLSRQASRSQRSEAMSMTGSTAASSAMPTQPLITATSAMYTKTGIPPQVVSYKEMCTTGVMEDNLALERLRKLVFEVKKSPKYGADILRGFEKRNLRIQRNQPLKSEDARCLINLSSLFYDNLYKEEIKGHSMKHAYFVLAFQNYVNGLSFKKDQANNVIVANVPALKVIKTLFEGQTRKIGANNFLRNIYTSKFSKIRIPEYQEMIIREILRTINTQRQKRGPSPSDLQIGGNMTESRSSHSSLYASGHDRGVQGNKDSSAAAQANTAGEDQTADNKKKPNVFKRAYHSVASFVTGKQKDGKNKDAKEGSGQSPPAKTQLQSASTVAIMDDESVLEFNKSPFEESKEPANHLSRTQRNPQQGNAKPEPEFNSDEYERIRIHLGAGAHGDQPRLSDIFLKDKDRRRVTQATPNCDSLQQDPYNAMRFLNQEIDEEILNKNCMLKDIMVDQHSDSSQAELQVDFDERKFFTLHRAILSGGTPPDHAPFDCAGKDLTDLCKHIVHQVLKSLVISTDLMPYSLRAMMKILVMKSESVAHPPNPDEPRQSTQDQPRGKTKLGRNQIYMLADLMIGCWLNTGFRNPSCYGVQQPTDREKGFSHNLFQSCRVIFEHLFSFQTLPETKRHQNFDVKRINKYILQFRDFIYIFYTRIIDVELPTEPTRASVSQHQGNKPQTQAQQVLKYSVNSSLIRMPDLLLISEILRKQKAVLQFKYISHIENKLDWSRFKNAETTYFLFTKMKRDRVVKAPTAEQNEASALRMVLSMASNFPLVHSDLGLNSNVRDSTLRVSCDSESASVSCAGVLKSNFSHTIKPDKKGKNPAQMLLKVLFKQLIYLVGQNNALINESMSNDLPLDKVLDCIRKRAQTCEDGSGIVIACQLMKKALKGLRLVTRSTMIPDEKQLIMLIQNRLLEKFSCAFQETYKQAYYNAVVTQDLKLQSFENDVERFVSRSQGLQESIEKVIAQWHIAKISACEVSLCVYQNMRDDFPCFQGIYLTRNCPIDQEWMALAKLIQFDIFDTPRLPSNYNNQQQLVPRQNHLVPSRQENQRIIYSEYRAYTDFTWVSILRPMKQLDPKKAASDHREITYLESLLLYLTTECKGIFQNLIRCDYLLESYQVKQVRQQNKAMLSNLSLQSMVNIASMYGCSSKAPSVDLSRLHDPRSILRPDWAAKWLSENQQLWELWNALFMTHNPRAKPLRGCSKKIDDYIKYIEIDEKFQKMNFIQKSIKVVQQNKNDTPLFLLEIDQLMQDRDGRAIKVRMTKRDVKDSIQDHGNFLQTFNFFLDNLLCDLTQNSGDPTMNYEQLVKQDAQTEKIRQSCQEFILRRIHNGLFDKIPISEWDKAMYKVIYERKKKMESGKNPDDPLKPLFKENEKDLNLYKVSIDMLKQLPKEETPRAKRRLLNDALSLAKHALDVLKTVAQEDDDYLFAYMMHYACTKEGKRRMDFRIFQQLIFMIEFGKGAGSMATHDEDPIDIQFRGLRAKIIDESNETAVKTLTKSSFVIF